MNFRWLFLDRCNRRSLLWMHWIEIWLAFRSYVVVTHFYELAFPRFFLDGIFQQVFSLAIPSFLFSWVTMRQFYKISFTCNFVTSKVNTSNENCRVKILTILIYNKSNLWLVICTKKIFKQEIFTQEFYLVFIEA